MPAWLPTAPILALLAAVASGCMATAGGGSTLSAIRQRDRLHCGIHGSLPGFSMKGADGVYHGFDVDYCRAIAAAVFGDDSKITYVTVGVKDRFDALASGKIDVLVRNTTWTLSRDTKRAFNFAPPTFYDGQGFLVRVEGKVADVAGLQGKRICVTQGTTSEENLREVLAGMKVEHTPVPVASSDALLSTYSAGQCDAVTADRSALVSLLSRLPNQGEHVVLRQTISREPLGPIVRHGDDQWLDIVKWVVFATFEAEELKVASYNADDLLKKSDVRAQRRLLGTEEDLGEKLGLTKSWAYQVIRWVGNYAEIYERNLGRSSPVPIPRGQNRLASEGGLLYSPPFR